MPSGVAHLRQLGIEAFLAPDTYARFYGIRYFTNGGLATGRFAEGPGWGMTRTTLSNAMYRRALAEPRLSVLENVRVAGIERSQGRWVVGLCTGKTFWVRLLIGADGLHSPVRRWAGLSGPMGPRRRWGLRRHFRMRPWSEYVEVYWGGGVEAYITPCGPNCVDVAFLWDEDQKREDDDAVGFDTFLRRFPALGTLLLPGEPLDTVRGAGPLWQTVRSPVADGVMLVGDAAGYIDAITGEGISLALAQTQALTDTAVSALKTTKDMPPVALLQPYARACRQIGRPYRLMTRSLLAISRHPRIADRIVDLLAHGPDVFQTLLSINMGYLPTPSRVAVSLARLVWKARKESEK